MVEVCGVTGLPYCDFMSFVDGMKPFIIRVNPDVELFEQFRTELRLLIELVNEELEAYKKYDYYE